MLFRSDRILIRAQLVADTKDACHGVARMCLPLGQRFGAGRWRGQCRQRGDTSLKQVAGSHADGAVDGGHGRQDIAARRGYCVIARAIAV